MPTSMPIIAVIHKLAATDNPRILRSSDIHINPTPINPNAETTCADNRAGSLYQAEPNILKNSTEVMVTRAEPMQIIIKVRAVEIYLPILRPIMVPISPDNKIRKRKTSTITTPGNWEPLWLWIYHADGFQPDRHW